MVCLPRLSQGFKRKLKEIYDTRKPKIVKKPLLYESQNVPHKESFCLALFLYTSISEKKKILKRLKDN